MQERRWAQAKFSEATAAIEAASKEIMADPELTPEQRQAAALKLASLQQYAARAALPDTVQKGAAVPPSSEQASASSGAPKARVAPEKAYNLNIGTPPAAAGSSGTSSGKRQQRVRRIERERQQRGFIQGLPPAPSRSAM